MKGKVFYKGKLKTLVTAPMYMTLLLLAGTVGIAMIRPEAAAALSAFTIIYFIVVLILYHNSKAKVYEELMNFATYYDDLEQQLLNNLEVPYAQLDQDGRIVWMNDAFAGLTGREHGYHKSINGVFSSLSKETLAKIQDSERFWVDFEGKRLCIDMKRLPLMDYSGTNLSLKTEDPSGSFFTMTVHDETKRFALAREVEEQKMGLALVYIDNYDEVMDSVEGVQGSLLAALIDQRVNGFFSGPDSLVKRFDDDKYIVVFKQRCLDSYKDSNFQVLEDTKDINLGNAPVTLSIGLGAKGNDYAKNYEYARAAMDLALGRGGDQAVLKEGDELTYYGGNTRQVDKASRVKARVKAQALQKLMLTKERVIVMGHHIADVDSFGASIGIYRAAKLAGLEAYVVIEEPNNSIRQMMDAFKSSGSYEGEVFVEGDRALALLNHNTLVVVCDVNKPMLTECPELLERAESVVVIDHHRQGPDYIENPTLSYVEPYASSACEMVTEVLQYFTDEIKLTVGEADCIYAGILVDTNNFMTHTGVRTFEAAAYLRRAGADMNRVRRIMQNDMASYKARAEAVAAAEVYRGAFAMSECPSTDVSSPTIAAAQAANELLNIQGIKASFIMTKVGEVVHVSSRSIDEVNVQIIMEKLGGGGHLNMAAAQLNGYSIEEVRQFITNTLDDMIEKGEIKL